MSVYRLLAEREGSVLQTGRSCVCDVPAAALLWGRSVVEEMDRDETWPEGHDALLVHPETGRKWAYIGDLSGDGWEEMKAEENTHGI